MPLELVDVADLVRGCDFKVFAAPAADPSGRVAALRVPQGGKLTRKEIDEYTAYVARFGAKGLAYIKVNEAAKGRDGSAVADFEVLERCGHCGNSGAHGGGRRRPDFFRRGFRQGGERCARGAAPEGRRRISSLSTPGWRPLWVVDFPMFEWDAEAKRWAAMHHPFTSPVNLDYAALAASPGEAIAKAYDLVLNGSEIGGGSVRIHMQELQSVVFDLLGISPEEARLKFGFLLDALKFGAPPHGGIAFGLGPAGDADGGGGQHSRRDCVSEDPDRRGPADGRAHRGERGAAEGTAHSPAHFRPRSSRRVLAAISAPGIRVDRDLHGGRRVSVARTAQAARVLAIGDRQPRMGRDGG